MHLNSCIFIFFFLQKENEDLCLFSFVEISKYPSKNIKIVKKMKRSGLSFDLAGGLRASPTVANVCLRDIKQLHETRKVRIEDRYILKQEFGGGKSGAYVFLVRNKPPPQSRARRTAEFILGDAFHVLNPYLPDDAVGRRPSSSPSRSYVLKMYPGTYKQVGEQTKVHNERPLREMYTLCKMSGKPGFPVVHEKGCAVALPWHKRNTVMLGYSQLDLLNMHELDNDTCVPYVVISLAPGKPLSQLQLLQLRPDSLLKISAQLLNLLKTAQEELGMHFQHFDLHPDNIYVDMDAESRNPTVYLIDFDLVRTNDLESAEALEIFSKKPLPEQKEKLTNSRLPVPERTVNFIVRWMPKSEAFKLLRELFALRNTDMRNWMAILRVFTYLLGLKEAVPCSGVHRCLALNAALLSKTVEAFPTRAPRVSPMSEQLKKLLKTTFIGFIGEEEGKKLLENVHTLDGQLYAKYGERVNQDSLAIELNVSFPANYARNKEEEARQPAPPCTPSQADVVSQRYTAELRSSTGSKIASVRVNAFNVVITGKALTPKFEIDFGDKNTTPGTGLNVNLNILGAVLIEFAKSKSFCMNTVAEALYAKLKNSKLTISKPESERSGLGDFTMFGFPEPEVEEVPATRRPDSPVPFLWFSIKKVTIEVFVGKETEISVEFYGPSILRRIWRFVDGLVQINDKTHLYKFQISVNGAGEPHVCVKSFAVLEAGKEDESEAKMEARKKKLQKKCLKTVLQSESGFISTLSALNLTVDMHERYKSLHVCGQLQARRGKEVLEKVDISVPLLKKILGSDITVQGVIDGTSKLTPLNALNLVRRIIGVKILNKKGTTTFKKNGVVVELPVDVTSENVKKVFGTELFEKTVTGVKKRTRTALGDAAELLGEHIGADVLRKPVEYGRSIFKGTGIDITRGKRAAETSYDFPDDDADSTGFTAAPSARVWRSTSGMAAAGAAGTGVGTGVGTEIWEKMKKVIPLRPRSTSMEAGSRPPLVPSRDSVREKARGMANTLKRGAERMGNTQKKRRAPPPSP